MNESNQGLIKKLDLDKFIAQFGNYLSRESNIFLSGDSHDHFRYINALEDYEFKAPVAIPIVEDEIKRLKKQGHIAISSIVSFFSSDSLSQVPQIIAF